MKTADKFVAVYIYIYMEIVFCFPAGGSMGLRLWTLSWREGDCGHSLGEKVIVDTVLERRGGSELTGPS